MHYFAYLDFGTGSMIVQAIIGLIAGIGIFARRSVMAVVHKVKSIFTHKKTNKEDSDHKK